MGLQLVQVCRISGEIFEEMLVVLHHPQKFCQLPWGPWGWEVDQCLPVLRVHENAIFTYYKPKVSDLCS